MLPNNKPYLIAETAFHHEGDIFFLEDLVRLSANSEADAVKFHLLFDLDDYMIKEHPGFEVLEKLMIKSDDWSNLFALVNKLGLDVIALVNDVASVQWVNTLKNEQVKAIEIHATGINDIFLLEQCAKFKGTVILGVGGSNFDEISFAINFLKENGHEDIFLMHGFQNYPTKFEDINLRRMMFLKEAFELPIGYADHTDPQLDNNKIISSLAVANGFNVVEKHLTSQPGEKRIDHQAAVDAQTFKEIKALMHQIYQAFGSDIFKLSAAELNYGDTGPMKKALVARKMIKKGQKITRDDIAFKRTTSSSSLDQMSFGKLIGAEALKDISKDEMLNFSNISYEFKIQDFSQFNVK